MTGPTVLQADLGPGVTTLLRPGDDGLPLFVLAQDDDLRSSAVAAQQWLQSHRATLDELLVEHGALVFRDFAIGDSKDFRAFVADYGFADLTYTAGASKRAAIDADVYEATALPPDVIIPLHQEMAYLSRWPGRLAFFSNLPAEEGGETIIGDMRKISAELPAELVEAVREHGILYRRNFRAPSDSWEHHPTLDAIHKPWPDAFGTDDPAHIEQFCKDMNLALTWEPDGSLTTEFLAPGFIEYPTLDAPLWFNQLHAQSMTLRTYGATNLALFFEYYPRDRVRPYETLLGNRSQISARQIDAIYDVLDRHTVAFPWQRGDVMVVDNIITMHGRNPFRGKRDTQVALLN
ncbi:TauD/TfdA family dioxygenase [Nakamurella alba]|nr:TauD/TfdA family dioxygenase [Nakamurella alba]